MLIDNFTQDIRVIKLVAQEGITKSEDMCVFLEQYKFVDGSLMANRIQNELNRGIVNNRDKIELWDIDTRIDMSRIPSNLIRLKEFDVAVLNYSGTIIDVAYNCFREPDYNKIENTFPEYTINYKAVTPFTFLKLIKTEEDLRREYKAKLVFFRLLIEAIDNKATDLFVDVIHNRKKPLVTSTMSVPTGIEIINLFDLDLKLNMDIASELMDLAKVTKADKDHKKGVVTNIVDPLGSSIDEIVESEIITRQVIDRVDTGEDYSVELRLTIVPSYKGYAIDARIQTSGTVNFLVDDLGFDKIALEDLKILQNKQSGVTFITGATGTGKNTTMLAMVNTIKKTGIRILEFSSPIEMLMDWVQVPYDGTPEDLYEKTRLAKKMKPELVLINEIPDKQVAFGVLDMANSGHSIMTTIHIDRLWDLPEKLYQYCGEDYRTLMLKLNGIINQKRFTKLCPNCRQQIALSSETIKYLTRNVIEFLERRKIQKSSVARGCADCGNTGYQSGIQPYVETLVITDEMRTALQACETPIEMSRYLKQQTMERSSTLEDKLIDAINLGDLPVDCLHQIV